MKEKEENPFTQLCVWPACVVDKEKEDEFVKFMADTFHGTRVKFAEEVKTLPDIVDGKVVKGTGDRNDTFFYVHINDILIFAVPRLAYGIRWWEDVVENKSHLVYPKEILDKYLGKTGEKGPEKPVVQLSGMDGNVFGLIGACQKALKKAGQADNATKLAMECFRSGSYDEALQIMMKYVDVE